MAEGEAHRAASSRAEAIPAATGEEADPAAKPRRRVPGQHTIIDDATAETTEEQKRRREPPRTRRTQLRPRLILT